MGGTAVKGEAELASEEARLARAAAAGDGSAVAEIYGRYEWSAFNFAYRLVGAEPPAADAVQRGFLGAMRELPGAPGGEPAFRPLLFGATRDACYELLHERRATPPGEARRATPPSEPVPGEEVREAAMRLPEHQREALALRELEGFSYEEIARIMDVGGGAVAQLISRARINLHDELRGNVLASVAAPSPECERALPLIAAREDGQLDAASQDAAWLDAHLAECGRCRLGVEVMEEACAFYTAWAPIAAPPGLLKETMAKAAIALGPAAPGSDESFAGKAANGSTRSGGSPAPGAGRKRRRVSIATGLAALLLLAGVAAVVGEDDPPATPVDPAAGSAKGASAASPESGAKAGKNGQGGKAGQRKAGDKKKAEPKTLAAAATGPAVTGADDTTSTGAPVESPATGAGAPDGPAARPSRPSGEAAVQPTRATSAPRPSAKPKPAATPTAVPQAAPAPPSPVEEPPPADESPGKSAAHADPPGKPADRPPK